MKIIVIIGAIVIVVLTILFFTLSPKDAVIAPETTNATTATPSATTDTVTKETEAVTGNTDKMASPDKGGDTPTTPPAGKIRADVFTGKLEVVNTGCFADGECYVEVDGKHVTTLMGWSSDTVGQILGVEGFGDLESHIGEIVEVYAQVNEDETYTLYGSEGFYVKLK